MHLFNPEDPSPLHFVGIAGAGMSALALIARRSGVVVTGCDADPTDVQDLVEAGIEIVAGHDADHIRGARSIVYTSALPADHPEIRAAQAAGIPVYRRAEALRELVRHGQVVAVAGTHGKTTTTVMVTDALVAAGADPFGVVGGRVPAWGGNARVGQEELFVVEADEYDRSFLQLEPHIAVINNVEADHLECYGTVEALEQAFVEFSTGAKRVLVGADDRGAARVARKVNAPVWRVGTSSDADFRLTDPRTTPSDTAGRVVLPDGTSIDLVLSVPGLHNLRNGAMAVAAAFALGLDAERAAQGLRAFAGVGRRFEILGTHGGVSVVDDYAHHPTEIAVTIGAARQRFPGRRLVVVFQPHLYSRTKTHGQALGIALSTADLVVVTDVYPAREKPLEGVTGQLVVKAAEMAGAQVEWIPDRSTVLSRLGQLVLEGDVVVTIGAGDITEVGRALVADLEGATA